MSQQQMKKRRFPSSGSRLEKYILQPDELRVLFSSDETILPDCTSQTGPDELIHLYRFHLLTGLRTGEVIGLQWSDIMDGQVSIKRSINYSGEMTPGKNAYAKRSFCISARAAAELEAQRQLLEAKGIRSDYVFPDMQTGEPLTQKKYEKRFRSYCRHNGIHASTPHALRATLYSMSIVLPTDSVNKMLGFSPGAGAPVDGERCAQMLDELLDGLLASMCF